MTLLRVHFNGWLRLSGVSELWLILLRAGLILLGWICTVAFLRLATDMPLFLWKGLPSLPPTELAPLHHYASAPLAFLPRLALICAPLMLVRLAGDPFGLFVLLICALGCVFMAWLIVAWRTPVALMKTATGCARRQALLLGLYLPVHCFLMALLVFLLAVCLLIAFVF